MAHEEPEEAAAALLADGRLAARAMEELPAPLRPGATQEAYRVQERVERRLVDAGLGPAVGYKIGCTTPVMQSYLGIAHPCAGTLLLGGLRRGEGTFEAARLCRPGVECEVAVEIGEDMPADAPVTAERAGHHVAAAMASIELVDDRWGDFRTVSTPTLIADHFFNAGCVLGPPVEVDPGALAAAEGRMAIGGHEVGRGRGSDILGDPLAALAWLATHLAARGRPLRRGAIVTLGSMVRTAWIAPGDLVEIEVAGLGGCALRLA